MTYREHKGGLIPTFCDSNGQCDTNPLDKNNAKDYFNTLYEKSLKIDPYHRVCFLGWVNPKTFQPLEEEEEETIESMNYQFEKNKLYAHLGDKLVSEFKEYKCFVAGGTITSLFCNREVNDIDVYFRSEKALIEFIEDNWSSGWIVANTTKATLVTYRGKDVQLIHFDYFKDSNEIFDTFDFTACMGSFDFADEQFHFHKEFFKDNSQRILKFNKYTSFPIVSLLRVQKYKEKGYNISKPEMIRIVLACMNLNITTLDELKEQLGGMYGINYDKAFKDQGDNFSLDQAIDKIENLSLDEDYFKSPEMQEFEDMDEFIDDIRKTSVEYFVHDNNVYRIRDNGTLKQTKNEPKGGIKVEAISKLNDIKLYKFVKKENNTYVSFYDEKFEYKIGGTAIPKGSCGTPVLYFNELKEIGESPYDTRDGAVLIEVEFDVEDFYRKSGDQVTLKKCRVIREVPKDEYKKYLDGDEDTVEENLEDDLWV